MAKGGIVLNSMEIDPAAVWARVYAHTDGAPDKRPLSRDLADWIRAEQQATVTYYHIARLAGSDGATLRHMAQTCAGHSHKLLTLHYFLTGQRLSSTLPETVPTTELPSLLADRYRAENAAAEAYQDAASCHPRHKALFETLAQESQRNAQRLLQLAQRYI